MIKCRQYTKFNYNDWFKELLTHIEDDEIKAKLIEINKDNRITYTEHCGKLEYFDTNGNKHKIEPSVLSNGNIYIKPRKEHEYNLCFQYSLNKELTGELGYITLKVDEN